MVQKSALIVVDMQNDFLKGGPLAVPKAEEIIPIINTLLVLPFDTRIATQDWHPANHCSFASLWQGKPGDVIQLDSVSQILWPDHCVQGTYGAEFSTELDVSRFDHVVHKGTEEKVDSYSTFFDNEKLRSTGLEDYLKKKGIQEVFFAGICTEYCVLYSVIDALELGFTTYVISDAIQGLNLQYRDSENAIMKMQERGVHFLTSAEVKEHLHYKEKIVDALHEQDGNAIC